MNNSVIYLLDFDGVICNSAVETAITGWQAATTLWQDMPKTVPQELVSSFRELRPMLETGYEAILAMRLLSKGETVSEIRRNYAEKIEALINEVNITIEELKVLFGETRDREIAEDLSKWISMNQLYSGVVEKLQEISQDRPWYIVTTKHERFVKFILDANGINLPAQNIYGLDRKISKMMAITEIKTAHPDATLYFIEDRLPALLNVNAYDGLSSVKLFLATWGYNTPEDSVKAKKYPITLLKLPDFLQLQ